MGKTERERFFKDLVVNGREISNFKEVLWEVRNKILKVDHGNKW